MNATDQSRAHNLLDTCIANGDGEVATGFLRVVIENPELSHKLLNLGEALRLPPLPPLGGSGGPGRRSERVSDSRVGEKEEAGG